MTENAPNIWVAVIDGQKRFLVGKYDETSGRYTRSLTPRERRLTGCSAESGSFSQIAEYDRSGSAQQIARRRYGYSRHARAYGNLGKAKPLPDHVSPSNDIL
jgi:hypothetical protein